MWSTRISRAWLSSAPAAAGTIACNIPASVQAKVGRSLHRLPAHPIGIIKRHIEKQFEKAFPGVYYFADALPPRVTVQQNFDELLIPADHVSRSPHDTYYYDAHTLLRTHTSAHQNQLIRAGHRAFLCSGDVYRRDEVDSHHYPVFHQMEGVRIFSPGELPGSSRDAPVPTALVEADLKERLESVTRSLFGNVEMRWVDAYFPFTDPSLELEIFYNDKWMEVLGCGVVARKILQQCGVSDSDNGWAFGLGLDRLAMILFEINDIRLFWSDDERFTSQFRRGEIVKFRPFSKYPPCFKDMSFWESAEVPFVENDLMELVRERAGDLVETVKCIDNFKHPKTGRRSLCYRITYRSMERSMTNEEVDEIQEDVRRLTCDRLRVQLR